MGHVIKSIQNYKKYQFHAASDFICNCVSLISKLLAAALKRAFFKK